MNLKISTSKLALAGLAVSLAAAFVLFGMTGLRTLVAMLLFFFLPAYLILKKFDFEENERVFFAFFIGIGLFSTLVFYVGRIVPSFRAATAIAFIALIALPFAFKMFKKKKS